MKSLKLFLPRFTLFGLLAWATSIAAAMAYLKAEWQGRSGGMLLGPLIIVRQGEVAGWVFAAILLPSIFLVVLKPHPATALVSVVAFLLWWLLGVLGAGMSC